MDIHFGSRAIFRSLSRQTAKMIIDLYLRHAEITGLFCLEAFQERCRTLALFADYLGDKPIEHCQPFHLSEWVESHPRWKSSSTRKSKANEVNACFNWAARERRIFFNPFASVSYKEAEPRPLMDDAVLTRMIGRANAPFARALRFLRLTGCRLSDLCRLVWTDVDLDAGLVISPRHKSSRTTRRPRVIVLLQEAVELLLEISREHDDDRQGPVFRNTQGRPWTRHTLGQALRRLKVKAKIGTPTTLHGIRHQFATTAVRNGAPIKLVSLQLGHSSVAVTERYYLHLEREADAIREAVKAALPRKTVEIASLEKQGQ